MISYRRPPVWLHIILHIGCNSCRQLDPRLLLFFTNKHLPSPSVRTNAKKSYGGDDGITASNPAVIETDRNSDGD